MDALATEPPPEPADPRLTRRLVIKNRLGLHARAAAKLATAAQAFKAEIILAHEEIEADVRSILALISLGCAYNSEVVVQAAGEDAGPAIDALSSIIENRFGEE
jgi:phosphotransferase system HPr (HPr) family protein